MIKRGTLVIRHKPAWDSEEPKKYKSGVIMKDDDGNVVVKKVHHQAEKYRGKCFSVIRLSGRKPEALFMKEGASSMSRVPLSELEEIHD